MMETHSIHIDKIHTPVPHTLIVVYRCLKVFNV